MPDNPYDYYRAVTRATLARILDVSPNVFKKWGAEGMPFDGNGQRMTHDVGKVVQWMIDRAIKDGTMDKRKKPPQGKPIDGDDMLQDGPAFDDNLDRYRSAKADLAEMEFKKRKGELIELEAHQKFVQEAGSFCRQSFQNIPKKISVQLAKIHDSQQVEKVLEAEIAKVLKDLSEKKV